MHDDYSLERRPPSIDSFRRLRAANDMPPRSREGIARGLPNSLFAVVAVDPTGETVGMGRVVGDGGSVYTVCDMAVLPDHQGRGIGTAVMEAILAFVRADAPPRADVTLMADVAGFYEQFGFEETGPASKGMVLRTGEDESLGTGTEE